MGNNGALSQVCRSLLPGPVRVPQGLRLPGSFATWPAQGRPCWGVAVSPLGTPAHSDRCPPVQPLPESLGHSPTIVISSDLITFYHAFLFLPRFLEYS